MDAELVQEMVKSGATALAGLMAKAAWGQASSRIARLFGRGERDQAAGTDLETIRAGVLDAGDDEEALNDQTAVLRTRLRTLFRDNPEAVEELRALLKEFAPEEPGQAGSVQNMIGGNATIHGKVIQARDITNLTI
ncbi:hypothetical protein [Kitasatospora sp. NPDC093558]|uniref:hypothetical protein n=1 Tax=Kitasatospora sp. NPDC093558 TaxID=3155201 RepID=UPI00341D03CA